METKEEILKLAMKAEQRQALVDHMNSPESAHERYLELQQENAKLKERVKELEEDNKKLRTNWHKLIDVIDPHEEDGPFCRDCADGNGTCDLDGLSCDPTDRAIEIFKQKVARIKELESQQQPDKGSLHEAFQAGKDRQYCDSFGVIPNKYPDFEEWYTKKHSSPPNQNVKEVEKQHDTFCKCANYKNTDTSGEWCSKCGGQIPLAAQNKYPYF